MEPRRKANKLGWWEKGREREGKKEGRQQRKGRVGMVEGGEKRRERKDGKWREGGSGKEEGKGWVESLAERTEISTQDQLGVRNYLRIHPKRNNRGVGR